MIALVLAAGSASSLLGGGLGEDSADALPTPASADAVTSAEGLVPGVLALTGTARNPQLVFRPDDGSRTRALAGPLISALGALDGWRAAIPEGFGGGGTDRDAGGAERILTLELQSRVVAAPPDERVPGDISRMSLVLPQDHRVNAGTAVRIRITGAEAITVEVLLASEFGTRWSQSLDAVRRTEGGTAADSGAADSGAADSGAADSGAADSGAANAEAPEMGTHSAADAGSERLAWIEVPRGSVLEGLRLLPTAR